jgi:hypothetical protein
MRVPKEDELRKTKELYLIYLSTYLFNEYPGRASAKLLTTLAGTKL